MFTQCYFYAIHHKNNTHPSAIPYFRAPLYAFAGLIRPVGNPTSGSDITRSRQQFGWMVQVTDSFDEKIQPAEATIIFA
jgi:hypothetical protein